MSLLPYADYANAICHKTQKAAQAMVQARLTAGAQELDMPLASVFGGIGVGDLTATRVVCECKRAVPQTPFEGNWDADLAVRVIAPAADIAEDDFHALAGQIFAFFFQEPATVASRLSNATIKYTAQFVWPTGANLDLFDDSRSSRDDVGNGSFMSEQNFRVTCSGSVID